ncbi:CRISPR-associated endoribonuclease Cas6 [Bacillus methanolicus]|uniref:CRISPR-associated endoribonuclease Cas6 n=1 Tax=Bacillus methanolicus TaxID=1471 RepID=UPI0023807E75|nr:CRISPR-associated endoribonuclease Cas6 [Bacillus methanolicus]
MLQGFLYRSIQDFELAHFLHNVGYAKEKRRFKMFTFSRLYGTYRIHRQEKKIEFFDQVTWYVSSMLDSLIVDLARNYLLKEQIMINGQPIHIEETFVKSLEIAEKCSYQIRMLSPLTVYSTYENRYGEKRTHFFSPFDPVFSDMVEKNFCNKFQAYFQEQPTERITIKPKKVTQKDKVVSTFKDFRINAWNGTFEIQAPLSYLKFMYEVGIGAKNSQGFGMFEIVE